MPKNSDTQSINDVMSLTSIVPSWLDNQNNPQQIKQNINNLIAQIQNGGKKSTKKLSKKKSKKY